MKERTFHSAYWMACKITDLHKECGPLLPSKESLLIGFWSLFPFSYHPGLWTGPILPFNTQRQYSSCQHLWANTGRFCKGKMDSHLYSQIPQSPWTNNQTSKTVWKQNHSVSAWKLGLISKSQYTHESNIRHYWEQAKWKMKHTGQSLKTQRGSERERLCRWCSGGKQGFGSTTPLQINSKATILQYREKFSDPVSVVAYKHIYCAIFFFY